MVKKNILVFLAIFIAFLMAMILLFYYSPKTWLISDINSSFKNDALALLLLGKPGPGYIGSENTDSIMVVYFDFKNNKVFLIPVPRDLIVLDDNKNFVKINSLYPEKKQLLLLKKVSEITGLDIENYIAYDLYLVLKLVDKVGGIEMVIKEPITDAVSYFTISPGKKKIDSYLAELVLRSRFNKDGDFFRIKNQIDFLSALKNKIFSLPVSEKIALLKFLNDNKYHWESNLDKNYFLKLFSKIKDLNNPEIVPILVDLNSGFFSSGYVNIYNNQNVYGIFPKKGVDRYDSIRFYIQSQIKNISLKNEKFL